jgi:hypothetical protein
MNFLRGRQLQLHVFFPPSRLLTKSDRPKAGRVAAREAHLPLTLPLRAQMLVASRWQLEHLIHGAFSCLESMTPKRAKCA